MSLSWREVWSNQRILLIFLAAFFLLSLNLGWFFYFLKTLEHKPTGVALPDPILSLLEPQDLGLILYPLTYVVISIGIAGIIRNPRSLWVAVVTYILVNCVRIITISLTNLEPPTGMYMFQDVITYGSSTVTKDLFFSGHTSIVCVLIFSSEQRALTASLVALLTLMVAIMLKMHFHYTIDIFIAPFIVYSCYQAASRLGDLLLKSRMVNFADGKASFSIG